MLEIPVKYYFFFQDSKSKRINLPFRRVLNFVNTKRKYNTQNMIEFQIQQEYILIL